MGFPQLSNIDSRIWNTIMDKSGNNLRASQTMPWIRVTSTTGNWLSMESVSKSETFAQKYGNTSKSGRVGITNDLDNNRDVYANDVNSGKPTTSKTFNTSGFMNSNGNDGGEAATETVSGTRGLRPSPTISSVSVTQNNEGLSKKTEFTIICYSLGQADIVMKYFLEPGNMVCVEWGENTKASIQQKVALNVCAVAELSGHGVLQKKRMAAGDMAMHTNPYRPKESNPENGGQYDAVLGYITGGGMKYGENETFEISVELSSVGELPAYLQHHKGIVGNDASESGGKFKQSLIEEDHDTGFKMFMLMYNDLPSHKRHSKIKNLKNDDWAVDASNFINFDKTLRENLLKQLSEGATLAGYGDNDKGEDIELMTDLPLFSDKRFIKVSLAFTILDLQQDFEQAPKGNCNLTPPSDTISWKNTILKAHKNIFSANSDYLHIPNKFQPNWDIWNTLQTTKSEVNSLPDKKDFTRNNNGNLELNEGKKENGQDKIVDGHPNGNDSGEAPKLNYFPRHDKCDFQDQAIYGDEYLPTIADPYKWGFLRDLYINFDFFCDCISKSGVVTKDVYYDLLNGLSSAVNLHWDFQITATKSSVPIYHPNAGTDKEDGFVKWYRETYEKDKFFTNCSNELQIIDQSMLGNCNEYVAAGIGLAKFQSRGIYTPFISCDFQMDIPGAMKGMVVARGQSGTASQNMNPDSEESYEDSKNGLFSVLVDRVKLELNPITMAMTAEENLEREKKEKAKLEAEETLLGNAWEWTKQTAITAVTWKSEATRDQDVVDDKQSKSNIEFFLNNVLVVPGMQGDQYHDKDIVKNWHDRLGSLSVDNIQDFICVGGWNDSALLKRIQRYNTQFYKDDTNFTYSEGGTAAQQNIPLLPIKFSFTIHGVSGLQVGNTFSIPDLPGNVYGRKIFQITSIEHSISEDLWTTSVEGSMRNMDAGSGNIKKYNNK